MKLIILGTLPGLNEYIDAERTSKYKAAAMKKQCEHLIIHEAKRQLKKLNPPVIMRYFWYEKDRRRDKDNITFGRKLIQDGIVKAGILPNDGWGEIAEFTDTFAVDKLRPRIEVIIEEVNP